jgi:hypothetical protein
MISKAKLEQGAANRPATHRHARSRDKGGHSMHAGEYMRAAHRSGWMLESNRDKGVSRRHIWIGFFGAGRENKPHDENCC